MTRSAIAVVCALLVTGPLALSQTSEQAAPPGSGRELPPGHPPVTTAPAAPATPALPPGHPPVPEGPAPPAPAHPDADEIRDLIQAYYTSISGPVGVARDWDQFRSLFCAEARLMTVAGDGAAPLVLTPDRFIAMNRKYFEAGGYDERSIRERIDAFGHVAHVWSTYESRRGAGAAPYSRGINSFQLVAAGGRWWIAGVVWDRERAGEQLPAVYLPARQ